MLSSQAQREWRVGEKMPSMPDRSGVEFTREHGCTEADWLRCLPGAVGGARWALLRPGKARIALPGGTLTLRWHALAPRRMGLMSMPRMSVHYFFDGVDDATREAFLRQFDLYLQRGGG